MTTLPGRFAKAMNAIRVATQRAIPQTALFYAWLKRHWPVLATSGAWMFIGGSLLALLLLIIEGGGGFGGTLRLLSARVDGQDFGAWGFTYSGFFGSLLLWLELLAVLVALVMSLLPAARLKRIGHAGLVAWSALWSVGAIQLAAINPGFWTFQSVFFAALLACTVWRAQRAWRESGVESAESPSAAAFALHEPMLTSEHISGSSRTIALN